ncbi:MAG TPA: hypothetical protein VGK73_27170 [Polyangiaceae bacterium]
MEEQREQAVAAESELWSWYLEWSQIARGVVAERQLLRELGFLKTVRSSGESDAEDEVEAIPAGAGRAVSATPA